MGILHSGTQRKVLKIFVKCPMEMESTRDDLVHWHFALQNTPH